MAAILFDFDGTIADTSQSITRSFMRVVHEFGATGYTKEALAATIGRPLIDVAREVCPGRDREFCGRYRELHFEDHRALARPYPGVREALDTLKASGVTMGIVTNKSRKMLEFGLEQFGFGDYFGATVCVEDVETHKPDPGPVLRALELLGISPGEALMVGDTVLDIMAGRRAGTQTAAATWGIGMRDELIAHQPDLVLDSIHDLLREMGLDRGSMVSHG